MATAALIRLILTIFLECWREKHLAFGMTFAIAKKFVKAIHSSAFLSGNKINVCALRTIYSIFACAVAVRYLFSLCGGGAREGGAML